MAGLRLQFQPAAFIERNKFLVIVDPHVGMRKRAAGRLDVRERQALAGRGFVARNVLRICSTTLSARPGFPPFR